MTTLSPSSEREEMTYFMPCVLRSAIVRELTILGQASSDPASLMIRYRCGYVPLGDIFSNDYQSSLSDSEGIERLEVTR